MKKILMVMAAVILSGCATGYEKVNCSGIYSIKTSGMSNNVIVKFDERKKTKRGYLYHQVPQLGLKISGGWAGSDYFRDFSCHGE